MAPIPPDPQIHPGLLLDKWHEPWINQVPKEFQRKQLERVVKASGDGVLLGHLRQRFQTAVAPFQSRSWRRKTSGALTLHLSRAGSFENAGICLHPLYGFAFLPGTGLKGMARSYARNIAGVSLPDIEEVFGKDTTRNDEGCVGGVIFFDAWPVQWPKLMVDIVNNHHREYYEGTSPPEDWEDPVPVNFLAVAPGTEFEFCVAARRRSDHGDRLLGLAQAWIDGALAWLGVGAKTNAGYGRFATNVALPPESGRSVFSCTLTLVGPAFLAGALQSREDCTLRPATLKGLLRWWWRTLHVGYVSVRELRRIEGQLWGTTETDSAISLHVEPVGNLPSPRQFSFVKPKDQTLAPGRFYLAYGMEGNPKQGKSARYFAEAGSGWKLTITSRFVESWNSQAVLDQAVLALWMLSNYGGIGAKCRRGFGSFDIGEPTLPLPADRHAVLAQAAAIRQATTTLLPDEIKSPSAGCLGSKTLRLKPNEVWQALDRLGEVYRSFTADEKRLRAKLALGLPRKIGRRGIDQQPLQHPAGKDYSRHASPLHFRLFKDSAGYRVRITALPSPHLPNLSECGEYLKRCMQHIEAQLRQ